MKTAKEILAKHIVPPFMMPSCEVLIYRAMEEYAQSKARYFEVLADSFQTMYNAESAVPKGYVGGASTPYTVVAFADTKDKIPVEVRQEDMETTQPQMKTPEQILSKVDVNKWLELTLNDGEKRIVIQAMNEYAEQQVSEYSQAYQLRQSKLVNELYAKLSEKESYIKELISAVENNKADYSILEKGRKIVFNAEN